MFKEVHTQTILQWNGKDITKLSKEELIEILRAIHREEKNTEYFKSFKIEPFKIEPFKIDPFKVTY
jgi:hypothetical protein